MRIVAFSDTHGRHEDVVVPDGDVLVFAGDYTGAGIGSVSRELKRFNAWLGSLPHKHKIVVAGNHDGILQRFEEAAPKLMPNAVYLQDREIVIDGVRFYGSPWTPEFMSWYFMLPRGGKEIASKWAVIPDETDVLITHGPAYSILDYIEWEDIEDNVGCKRLYDRCCQLKLKAHIFGHIHSGYGQNGISYNVSVCNEAYEPANAPIVIDL